MKINNIYTIRKFLHDIYGIEPIVELAHSLAVAFSLSWEQSYRKIYELHLEKEKKNEV